MPGAVLYDTRQDRRSGFCVAVTSQIRKWPSAEPRNSRTIIYFREDALYVSYIFLLYFFRIFAVR